MEVKSGYKLTVVGVIPEDWDIVELGTVIDYTKGFAFKSDDYQSDGVRIIRVSDTSFDSIKNVKQIYIDRDKAYLYDKWMLKELDLILSTVGSKPPMYDSMVGKAIIIEKQYDGTLLNQNAVLIRSKKRKPYKQTLLLNNFRTKRYLKYIEAIFRGNANQASITLNDLFHFQLALPRKDAEQEAIATALSDVDALITSLDQLIAKKRNIKQATMQQLLTGKMRLLGFSGEWEVKKLGEITQSTAGGTPSTLIKEYWGGNIKWMNSGELNAKKIYDVEGRITEEGLNNSSTKILPSKCILVGLAGQGKTRGTIAINMVELCTNQSIAAIFPSHRFIAEYLYFNLDSRYDELRNLSTGEGGRGGLNLSIINSLMISLPSLSEQTAIATVLSDMDAEITALEQKRDKTRALKQGMMQELLTGKTRLL